MRKAFSRCYLRLIVLFVVIYVVLTIIGKLLEKLRCIPKLKYKQQCFEYWRKCYTPILNVYESLFYAKTSRFIGHPIERCKLNTSLVPTSFSDTVSTPISSIIYRPRLTSISDDHAWVIYWIFCISCCTATASLMVDETNGRVTVFVAEVESTCCLGSDWIDALVSAGSRRVRCCSQQFISPVLICYFRVLLHFVHRRGCLLGCNHPPFGGHDPTIAVCVISADC